jgi:hypothetical protein
MGRAFGGVNQSEELVRDVVCNNLMRPGFLRDSSALISQAALT